MKIINAVVVVSALFVQSCTSYHVLMYHNIGTKSHILQYEPLVEELLARGHEVTTCFFHPLKIEHKNYTQIVLPNVMEEIQKEASKLMMEEGGQTVWNYKLWQFGIRAWSDSIEDIALMPMRVKEVDSLMKSGKKVDVMVTMLHHATFLADHFDCPIIFYVPVGPVSFLDGMGNVDNLSLQPLLTARYIEPMTFTERLLNHLQDRITRLVMAWVSSKVTGKLQEQLGPHVRHPQDIMRDRFSVLIGGHHPVTHGAWAYLPNTIGVGAMHLKDAKPLPEDLKKFMDSASDGVVFVSFGSTLSPSKMPKEKLELFLETFKSLKMSVLWKWDAEVPNLPKNVRTASWVPQQDLLGHPNLKVFVTHGGLGSLQEAIYHKAVIIGIPFSNDQRPNILRAARHGYAKMLDWDALTAADLTAAINDGMTDEGMRSSLERVHGLYTDTQQRPRERAAWWVEYVCRHGGAEMLQSRHFEDAPWYQFHHVDVIAFVAAVVGAVVGAFVLTCKLCCRLCCRRKVKSKTE